MRKILMICLSILMATTVAFGANELGGLVDRTTGKGIYDARTIFPTFSTASNLVSQWSSYPASTNLNINGLGITNFTSLASRTSTATTNYGFAFGIGSGAFGNGSFASGYHTIATGLYSHAEGRSTLASGIDSHSEGNGTTASGSFGHSEGSGTAASGQSTHSEGQGTIAFGLASHAEGNTTLASNSNTHAEGINTVASGINSHVEGNLSKSSGDTSHAEGYSTTANGQYSHSEGQLGFANGIAAHSEGYLNQALGDASHAEGGNTISTGLYSHAEGWYTIARGNASHAEGTNTIANGLASHTEGQSTISVGDYSHAGGNGSIATGTASFAHGTYSTSPLIDPTVAIGGASHAEGQSSVAVGFGSHAEGQNTIATGPFTHSEGVQTKTFSTYGGAHSEGWMTKVFADYAGHAEGISSVASNNSAHAEGNSTTASGIASHSEGTITVAFGDYSHAEGSRTHARGIASHAEGYLSDANGDYSHAAGMNMIVNGSNSWGWSDGTSYTVNDNSNFVVAASGGMTLYNGPFSATNDGRSIWGIGWNIANIHSDSPGCMQAGYNNRSTLEIINSHGSVQRGWHDHGTSYMWGAAGSSQEGTTLLGGNMYAYNVYGCEQRGSLALANSKMTVIDSTGVSQLGEIYGAGEMYSISNRGSAQIGYINGAGIASNRTGSGSVQLFNLVEGEKSLMTGKASLGLGACTVSNNQSIVAGNLQESHGDGSITAGGLLYGSSSAVVNGTLSVTNDGRSIWGNNLKLSDIMGYAPGADQHGENIVNTGTMQMIGIGYGSCQRGAVAVGGTMYMTNTIGGIQNGSVSGASALMLNNVYAGGSQFGQVVNGGRMVNNANSGSAQFGLVFTGIATNGGNGSIQLLNLTAGEIALMNGSASLGLGACIVSDDQSIVAGDLQISHGVGSITASGGFWSEANSLTTNSSGWTMNTNVVINGDLTIVKNLYVTNIITTNLYLTITNLWTEGSVAVGAGVNNRGPGTISCANGYWSKGTSTNYFGSIVSTNDGRSVWGSGLNIANIDAGAKGAVQRGLDNIGGARSIGNGAYGVLQSGQNGGSMIIEAYSSGAQQLGYNAGTMRINGSLGGSLGSQQIGYNDGTMLIDYDVMGGMQRGKNYGGSMTINAGSHGASQIGFLDATSSATNSGVGALQLFELTSQNALTTSDGDGSILLGAGVASNRYAIVAGDNQISHGNESITAGGGFWTTNSPALDNWVVNYQRLTNYVDSASYRKSFSNADLVGANMTIAHNLNQKIVIVQVYNNSDQLMLPTQTTLTDANTVTLNFTGMTPLVGAANTWNVVIRK